MGGSLHPLQGVMFGETFQTALAPKQIVSSEELFPKKLSRSQAAEELYTDLKKMILFNGRTSLEETTLLTVTIPIEILLIISLIARQAANLRLTSS